MCKLPERVVHRLCKSRQDTATGLTKEDLKRETLVDISQVRLTLNFYYPRILGGKRRSATRAVSNAISFYADEDEGIGDGTASSKK